jgi:hypothetical protein
MEFSPYCCALNNTYQLNAAQGFEKSANCVPRLQVVVPPAKAGISFPVFWEKNSRLAAARLRVNLTRSYTKQSRRANHHAWGCPRPRLCDCQVRLSCNVYFMFVCCKIMLSSYVQL